MTRRMWIVLFAIFVAWCAGAPALEADLSGAVTDAFDVARAPQPKPGEWLEYRVAFPVDPLEHSLSPDRGETAPSGRTPMRIGGGDEGEYVFFVPHFEPERMWRVAPLRLEVREVEADGCNVVMTFAGRSHELFMKKDAGGGDGPDFYYDSEESADARREARIGEHNYEVEEVRRISERYGLVRWTSPEVPFGIVRFATPDLDMALVGMGIGRAPDFPLELRSEIEPPLGLLYNKKE